MLTHGKASKHSTKNAQQTRCVLPICPNWEDMPALMILIMLSLSLARVSDGTRPEICSHRVT
eukprot:9712512-Prorocentrum_lima.AAC.1